MVIYRAVGVAHGCPGATCTLCTQNYSPPPANPTNYEQCCNYTENGERIVVVIADIPAGLKAPATRPTLKGAGLKGAKKAKKVAAPMRAFELQPRKPTGGRATPARTTPPPSKSVVGRKKKAASLAKSATRRGKSR